MTTILIILFVIFWLSCSILCYGMTLAYFSSEYASISHIPGQARSQKQFAVLMGLNGMATGPIAMTVIFFLSGCAKHGLKFR